MDDMCVYRLKLALKELEFDWKNGKEILD